MQRIEDFTAAFQDERHAPSRRKLLAIAIGMELSEGDIQDLLRRCGYAPLYPRYRRDAIILHGLDMKMNLIEINDMLLDEKEEGLL